MLTDDPELKKRAAERLHEREQQEAEAQRRSSELHRPVREWAVCPQLYTPPELAKDGQFYLQIQWRETQYFPTEDAAQSHHRKYQNESLAPVQVTRAPSKYPSFSGTRFSDFLPIDQVKGHPLSHPTLLTSERTQPEECIACAINPKGRWRIGSILNEAALGLGHTIGGQFENPLQALLSGAHDLERTLYGAHPTISADAVIDFWTSFEVHEAIQQHAARIEARYSLDQVRIALVILRKRILDYLSEMLGVSESVGDVNEVATQSTTKTPRQKQIDCLLADAGGWSIDEWARAAQKLDARKTKKIDRSTAYRFYNGARVTARTRYLLAQALRIKPEQWK